MSVILFILGSVVTGAGIVAIGFGIPINEFNLGNTLIVSGTIAFAAGLILIGLAAAVDQLSQIAKSLRVRPATRPQSQAAEPASLAAVRPAPASSPMPAPASVQAKPPAPRNPIFAKAEPDAAASAPEVPSSAIERLRSSLPRKPAESPDEDVAAAPMAPAAAASGSGSNGATPPSNAAGDAPRKPPLDFLFRAKREAPAEPFDAVWPKRGSRRGDEPPPEASAGRSSDLLPQASGLDEARPTAILKSGVVDGMAYTLYVDGSIEAQLPQGTVRFGSIAELRSHIENNS